MLTKKQNELLIYIHQNLRETGIAPSYEEMKDALDLRSKSGIHRLIHALEERGFIRRLPHRARAIEIIKLPTSSTIDSRGNFRPEVIDGGNVTLTLPADADALEGTKEKDLFSLNEESFQIRMMGKIAAGRGGGWGALHMLQGKGDRKHSYFFNPIKYSSM